MHPEPIHKASTITHQCSQALWHSARVWCPVLTRFWFCRKVVLFCIVAGFFLPSYDSELSWAPVLTLTATVCTLVGGALGQVFYYVTGSVQTQDGGFVFITDLWDNPSFVLSCSLCWTDSPSLYVTSLYCQACIVLRVLQESSRNNNYAW